MVIYSLHKESCVCILEIWQGSENNIDCRDNYWGKKQTKKAPAEGGWCGEVVGHKLSQFSVCVRREAGECKKVDTLNIFSFQSRFEYKRIWVQINGCIFPYLDAVNLMSIVHIYVCVTT